MKSAIAGEVGGKAIDYQAKGVLAIKTEIIYVRGEEKGKRLAVKGKCRDWDGFPEKRPEGEGKKAIRTQKGGNTNIPRR